MAKMQLDEQDEKLAEIPAISQLMLRLPKSLNWTDEQYYQLCQANRDLQIERTEEGDLLIMPPTGGRTGRRNFKLLKQFADWEEQDGRGVGFDSSTGFLLPNGAVRSPDVAWLKQEKWAALTTEQQEGFIPLCPDFLIELRSPSDKLATLQAKMVEYIENGTQLGWLIDPADKRVYIYRPDRAVECLENPEVISGEPVLSGFQLPLATLW